jgi:tetratricopeptide (TPR) repeat protein
MINNDFGRIQDARDQFDRAVAIARELDNFVGERVFLSSLGLAQYYLGNYSVALSHYSRALTLSQEAADRRTEGRIVGAYRGRLRESESVQPGDRRLQEVCRSRRNARRPRQRSGPDG